MRRREFITLLGGAAAWPGVARAQQGVDRVRRVAVLVGSAQTDEVAQRRVATFRKRMQELGWIEGQTVSFEFRRDAGDTEQITRHAAELVAARPDVILAISSPVVAALKQANTNVPIVFAVVADPVADGFVASLSRPGGNVTGFSSFDPEIGGKWVQLLTEMAPRVRRIGLLFNPRTAPAEDGHSSARSSMQRPARPVSRRCLSRRTPPTRYKA